MKIIKAIILNSHKFHGVKKGLHQSSCDLVVRKVKLFISFGHPIRIHY